MPLLASLEATTRTLVLSPKLSALSALLVLPSLSTVRRVAPLVASLLPPSRVPSSALALVRIEFTPLLITHADADPASTSRTPTALVRASHPTRLTAFLSFSTDVRPLRSELPTASAKKLTTAPRSAKVAKAEETTFSVFANAMALRRLTRFATKLAERPPLRLNLQAQPISLWRLTE